MKIFILLVLLVIVGNLGSALYYLLKDKNRSPRTVRALTYRIGLSIALFLLLIVAFGLGWIQPHGLRGGAGPKNPAANAPITPNTPGDLR
ncbi:twin transmembrane helix small protein [Methylomagnum sp.]